MATCSVGTLMTRRGESRRSIPSVSLSGAVVVVKTLLRMRMSTTRRTTFAPCTSPCMDGQNIHQRTHGSSGP